MDQDKTLHQAIPLPMRLSMRSECPYLPGRVEQRVAVDIDDNPEAHDELARAGFRRVENWVYKPACPSCNACMPWRVNCEELRISRNLGRIKRANQDLTRERFPIRPTAEHYNLFQRYIKTRHGDGQMAGMPQHDFVNMIENSPIETLLMNYRDSTGALVGTVLTDVQSDGLSAVYSFFDPAQSARSLGTYMVLDLAECAHELGFKWLYLGYYVEDSQKMMYKARFRPAEVFVDGKWTPFTGIGIAPEV